jgi:hypothetical protein
VESNEKRQTERYDSSVLLTVAEAFDGNTGTEEWHKV